MINSVHFYKKVLTLKLKKTNQVPLLILSKKLSKIWLFLIMIQKFQSLFAICAHFYALPKVHKINNPLRPIVSNLGTATYPLSQFLVSIFSPLWSINIYTIKNSYDFVNKLKTFNPGNCLILSLDIKSLFIHVPIEGLLIV